MKQLMLWCGTSTPAASEIEMFYAHSRYGNEQSFQSEFSRLAAASPHLEEEELTTQAFAGLPLRDRSIGEFRWYQLLTSSFLHSDIVHLAGNMLVLLILRAKINAVIGNVAFTFLYFLLCLLSGLTEYLSTIQSPPIPCIGASGVAMGMAGMYLILFPSQRVHIVAWARPLVLIMKIFACAGAWIVLFYIAFDCLAVCLAWDDHVAHWAHLGGFFSGLIMGLVLLLGRQIDSRGTDLLSVLMGQHAWAWIGTPHKRRAPSWLSKWP